MLNKKIKIISIILIFLISLILFWFIGVKNGKYINPVTINCFEKSGIINNEIRVYRVAPSGAIFEIFKNKKNEYNDRYYKNIIISFPKNAEFDKVEIKIGKTLKTFSFDEIKNKWTPINNDTLNTISKDNFISFQSGNDLYINKSKINKFTFVNWSGDINVLLNIFNLENIIFAVFFSIIFYLLFFNYQGKNILYFFILALISVVVYYFLLHLIYEKGFKDDAWSLSFIHNYFVKHLESGFTFGGGLASIEYFGKSQALIYAPLLSIFGWTKSNVHIISSLLIFLSGAVWYFILTKIGFDKKVVILFSLLIVFCEPFIISGNISRPEATTFFFVSLALLFLVYDIHILAGFFALVAVENHPMGIISLFLILAIILSNLRFYLNDKKKIIKSLIFLSAGIIIGGLYYIFLHYNILSTFKNQIRGGTEIGNTIIQYFKYQRGMPFFKIYPGDKITVFAFLEFLLIFSAIPVFIFALIKGKYKENKFVFYYFILTISASILIPRNNMFYMLMYYPAFLIVLLFSFKKEIVYKTFFICLFSLFLLKYYDKSINNCRYRDYRTFEKNIPSYIPDKRLAILGASYEYYAFINYKFYAATETDYFNSTDYLRKNDKELYLIEDNDSRMPDSSYAKVLKEYLDKYYNKQIINSVVLNNERFDIVNYKIK
jgi:hypothetical protein